MSGRKYDWDTIAKSRKFLELQRKKTGFLLCLWIVGATPYLLLTIAAGYAPDLLNTRVLGRMNLGYIFCLSQFFMMIGVGIYYTYRTNKHFDPLTKELVEEIHMGR